MTTGVKGSNVISPGILVVLYSFRLEVYADPARHESMRKRDIDQENIYFVNLNLISTIDNILSTSYVMF